jgi:tetratricopeptide (TPR) repeat protein
VSDIHITPELLEAVKRGDLPPHILLDMGWNHLISLCPTCRAGAFAWQDRQDSEVNYEASFRVLPVLLKRHATDEAEHWTKSNRDFRALLGLTHEQRLVRIRRANTRFKGVLLAHRLLNEAKRFLPEQPQMVLQLAEAAECVLLHTPHASGYYDALARATAYRANALRSSGKLREADERMATARSLVRHKDVTDLLVYAEVDCFEGSLRKDQRRFKEAEELLVRSSSLFELAGEKHEAARPLLVLGAIHHHRQNMAKAVETTQAALAFITPHSAPRLYLCGRHNLALFFVEGGRYDEAAELLRADERLYWEFADRWTTLRQLWLKGKIAFAGWQFEAAEDAFLKVRDGFLGEGVGYDAAMVCLDLALLYLKENRPAQVRQLAEEMHAVFAAEDIHREALAALRLFVESAGQEALTIDLVEDVAAYLKRARENPELRFLRQP